MEPVAGEDGGHCHDDAEEGGNPWGTSILILSFFAVWVPMDVCLH